MKVQFGIASTEAQDIRSSGVIDRVLNKLGVLQLMGTMPRERLRTLIEQKCLLVDTNIELSTGAESSFYFDCKKIMLDGEGLDLISQEILVEINNLPSMPMAIGGLTMGADFIVSAVIAKAHTVNHPTVHGSIVRKEPKQHGTKNKIENQLEKGTKIVVVDDVITSGSSIKKACQEFMEVGYEIVGIIALVDRKAGGKESLEKEFNTAVRPLFSKDDFAVIGELAGVTGNQERVIA